MPHGLCHICDILPCVNNATDIWILFVLYSASIFLSIMADSISTTRAPTPTNNRSTIPTTPAPPPPMTTDFAVIEAQKENIRPAASGRSAATLSTLLDKGNAEVDRVVQEGHDRLKRDIEEAERRDREGEEMENGYTDILDAYNR